MEIQVFISYARRDDGELSGAWVTYLVKQLHERVNALVTTPGLTVKFKFDLQLNGHELLGTQIQVAIRQSSILVAIGSKAFLNSDWCINREVPQFLAGVNANRILIVEKNPYLREKLPGPLAGRIGRKFWEEDTPSGAWRTFGDPVSSIERDGAYFRALAHLTQEIADLADKAASEQDIQPPLVREISPEGPAVFLAEGSPDLEELVDGVRSYLRQHEITVITPETYPADSAVGYTSRLRQALRRDGIIFAQLLSALPGRLLPEDLPQEDLLRQELLRGNLLYQESHKPSGKVSCSILQYEIASRRKIPIYQWRSNLLDINTVTALGQRQLLTGHNVHTAGIEDFKAMLVRRAKEPPVRVVISRDASTDDQFAAMILDTLRRMSLSAGCADLNDPEDRLATLLRDCETHLSVHGQVPARRLRQHIAECSSIFRRRIAPTPRKAIILGPPSPKAEMLEFKYIKPDLIDLSANEFDEHKLREFFEFMQKPEE